jgi:hypothetical protein
MVITNQSLALEASDRKLSTATQSLSRSNLPSNFWNLPCPDLRAVGYLVHICKVGTWCQYFSCLSPSQVSKVINLKFEYISVTKGCTTSFPNLSTVSSSHTHLLLWTSWAVLCMSLQGMQFFLLVF